MPETGLVKEILREFSEKLQQAVEDGLVSKDYLVNYRYQRGRKAHGRIIGILAKVGFDLKYYVDIDCNFFGGMYRFDIVYLTKSNVIALMDYESLNSYDVRGKHRHFESYIRNCRDEKMSVLLPKACILIVTLPEEPVKRLPYYCNKEHCKLYENEWKKIFNETKAEKRGIKLYEYWFSRHREAFLRIHSDVFRETTFCLCNLNEKGLTAEIWTSPDENSIKLTFPLTWS